MARPLNQWTTPETGTASDRLIPWTVVSRMVVYARMSVWRLEAAQKFPPRVQLGENRVAWWESEILAWMNDRPVVQKPVVQQPLSDAA